MNYVNQYHPIWQEGRINYIFGVFDNEFGKDFLKNKTVLELAPFNGYIGNKFFERGSKVTCVEGREENYKHIKTDFPHLITHLSNLDTNEWLWGKFDIIINWGLLYHLEKFHEALLDNCIKNSSILLLETVINGSNEPVIEECREYGADQSLSGIGGRPSVKWIENILERNNCKYSQVTVLNCGSHKYDGSGGSNYNRRMWIVHCPQIQK